MNQRLSPTQRQLQQFATSGTPAARYYQYHIVRDTARGIFDPFFTAFAKEDTPEARHARAIAAQIYGVVASKLGLSPANDQALIDLVYVQGSITKGRAAFRLAVNEGLRSYLRDDGVIIQCRHTKDMDHLVGSAKNFDEVVAPNLLALDQALQMTIGLFPDALHYHPGFWHLPLKDPDLARGLRREDKAYMIAHAATIADFVTKAVARGDWAWSRSTHLEIAQFFHIACGLEPLRPKADMDIITLDGAPYRLAQSLIDMLPPLLFALQHQFHLDVEPREWLRRMAMADLALQGHLTRCNPELLRGIDEDRKLLAKLRAKVVPLIQHGMNTGHFYVDRKEFGLAAHDIPGTNLMQGEWINPFIYKSLPAPEKIPTKLGTVDQGRLNDVITSLNIKVPRPPDLTANEHGDEIEKLRRSIGFIGGPNNDNDLPKVETDVPKTIAAQHRRSLFSFDPAAIPLSKRDVLAASILVIHDQVTSGKQPFCYLAAPGDSPEPENFNGQQRKLTQHAKPVVLLDNQWIEPLQEQIIGTGHIALTANNFAAYRELMSDTADFAVTTEGAVRPTEQAMLLSRHAIIRRQPHIKFIFSADWSQDPDLVQDRLFARRLQMGLEADAAASPSHITFHQLTSDLEEGATPSLFNDVQQLWSVIKPVAESRTGDLSPLAVHIESMFALLGLSEIQAKPDRYLHMRHEARRLAASGNPDFADLYLPDLQYQKISFLLNDPGGWEVIQRFWETEINPVRDRLGIYATNRHFVLFPDIQQLSNHMAARQAQRRMTSRVAQGLRLQAA